jgi:hypothetical protein
MTERSVASQPDNGTQPDENTVQVLAEEFAVSFFNHVLDNKPKPKVLAWPQLCDLLTKHTTRENKDGRLISPTKFEGKRCSANAREFSLLFLDFDGGTTLDTARGLCDGLDAIIYTTFGHELKDEDTGVRCEKYRVVIRLARPVAAADWLDFWQRAAHYFGAKSNDEICKDLARMYYLPAHPPETAEFAHAEILGGAPLDPDSLPAIDTPATPPQPPRARINGNASKGSAKYLQTAHEGEINRVRNSGNGFRNINLNKAAFALGQLIQPDGLNESDTRSALLDVALSVGLSQSEAQPTIESGIKSGKDEPRDLSQIGQQRGEYRAPQAEPEAPNAENEPEPEKEISSADIRKIFREKARDISEPMKLSEVIARFRDWLYLEDSGLLEVYLGAIAANLMDGDPVWLMIVGASGGGKTEPLNAAMHLHFVHLAATVTESSLLSGTPKKDKSKTAKGGLLREIGPFGFLLLKDFTSMLSQRHDTSAAVLSAFREIYDGSWTRHVGSDGGTTLHWEGKLGVIAGCTDTIDSHHAVIGTMGERFAFYRLPEVDERKLSRHALKMAGKEAQMRAELSHAVCGLFAGVELPESLPEISDEDLERLIDLASLTARCRSAVDRDNHTRDITLTLSPEAPTRIAKILRQLLHGMEAIGVERPRIWEALAKIAFDSMHKVRRAALDALSDGDLHSTSEVATAIKYPTPTARRALEELHAHGVLICIKGGRGKADEWEFSDWAKKTFAAVKQTFPPQKQTFPVIPTDDISTSSLEEDNDSKPVGRYMNPEKRERSKKPETEATGPAEYVL